MSDSFERQVFDVDQTDLLNFLRMTPVNQIVTQMAKVHELGHTSNTSVFLKFCDVCKSIKVDPMNPRALHIVVIFVSKIKH